MARMAGWSRTKKGWKHTREDGKVNWYYGINHPNTGKGGKGVPKSAAHRKKMSEAAKRYLATPEGKKQRSEALKRHWQKEREKHLAYGKKGAASSQKTFAERRYKREQVEKLIAYKFDVKHGHLGGDKYLGYVKQAANALIKEYGIEVEQEQDISYYEEILNFFKPEVLDGIKGLFPNKK